MVGICECKCTFGTLYTTFINACNLQAPNPRGSIVRTEIYYVGQCYSFPDKSNCICVTTKSHDRWYLVAKSEVRTS